MKKFLKNPEGFTLVELMVVVAIIGILSAIAVPNFKKYQAKSKQSEAKLQLAAVYSAEVGANADYDTYATCLTELGYEAQPKGYYRVGFSATDAATMAIVVAKNNGVAASCNAAATSFAPAPPAGVATQLRIDMVFPTQAALVSVAPDDDSYTASAAGNISNTAGVYDIWQITQGKTLTNNQIGF